MGINPSFINKKRNLSIITTLFLLNILTNTANAKYGNDIIIDDNNTQQDIVLKSNSDINVVGNLNVDDGVGLNVNLNKHKAYILIDKEAKIYSSSNSIILKDKIDYRKNVSRVSIVNKGKIESRKSAIYANESFVLERSKIENRGLININPNKPSKGGAIEFDGAFKKSRLYNYGSINVKDTYGLVFNFVENSTIKNNGDINIESNKDLQNTTIAPAGIIINYLSDSKIINNGNIINDIKDGYNADIVIGESDFLVEIINKGKLIATHNNKLDNKAFSYFNNTESIRDKFENRKNAIMKGNIYLLNGGSLVNSGIISLPYNANASLNLPNFNKNTASAKIYNFINESTGVLQIAINTDESGDIKGRYSQLETNTAEFKDGSTIDVNVMSASNNQMLLDGTKFTKVVSAKESLKIDGKLNITDNSALLDFNYTKDGNNIDLIASKVKSAEDAVDDNSNDDKNNTKPIKNKPTKKKPHKHNKAKTTKKVAAHIIENSGSKFKPVVSDLNKQPTDKDVVKAVESTTQEATVASVGANFKVSNIIENVLQSRQNFNLGLNSGDTLFSQNNFWIKPYISYAKQDDRDSLNGYNVRTKGLGLGIDGEYAPSKNIGLALFYTKADVDVHNISQSADLDIFSLLAYGSMPIFDSKTKFLYSVGYSWQKTDITRAIFNGKTATADYTSKIASLDLKLLRDYKISPKLSLNVAGEFNYVHLKNPSFKENGADELNLNTKGFNLDMALAKVSIFADYRVSNTLSLNSYVDVGYDFCNDKIVATSSYQGAPTKSFTTYGIDNGKWSYNIGIGATSQDFLGGKLEVGYNFNAQGTSFKNHTLSARYIKKF